MIEFPNRGRLLTNCSELPEQFVGAQNVILDFETTSGDPKRKSTNPWHHCSIAGFALTVDDCDFAIYFDYMRAPVEQQQYAADYLQRLLWQAERWTNHNVKYDAHVAISAAGIQLPPWLELKCTLTRAKIIDSDRGGARGGYGLDALMLVWCGKDIRHYEARMQKYLGKANKDYGNIPPDILGEYACEDVFSVQALEKYIDNRLPERSKNVAATEVALTSELVKLEQTGMRFDPTKLQIAQFQTLNRICKLDAELTTLVGRTFRPTANQDCNEILCGQYGLPIVKYTKGSEDEEAENASFDKYALKLYEALPYAPHDVISKIIEYRKLSQRNSLFLTPWQELCVGGELHCTYNQTVRTGRMSCSKPNMQQLDDFMLSQIIPPPGWSIISTDAAGIEFRFIVHYIQDPKALQKFRENADADFHAIVAEMCGIKRGAAKTINFGTAFGEGKTKIIAAMAANPDIVAAVKREVDALNIGDESAKIAEFNVRIAARGTKIYNDYHKMLPTLKSTAKAAEKACKLPERRLGSGLDQDHSYGYITNTSGRDRHLPYFNKYRYDYKTPDPYDKAWLAFPTLNQASAADLMKERFVALMRACDGLPIKALGIVHDEIVLMAPDEIANDPRTLRDIVAILESPATPISVPIRWSIGVSNKNWLSAATPVKDGGVSQVIQYNKSDATNLEFLK